MGRAFTRVEDRLTGYTLNVTGSLAGIAAMTALSYLRTPPELWFATSFQPTGFASIKTSTLGRPRLAMATFGRCGEFI